MSKNSPKQRYEQLKLWLADFKKDKASDGKPKRFSKFKHREKVNKRYGYKKSY
jgi:hypothetical protein